MTGERIRTNWTDNHVHIMFYDAYDEKGILKAIIQRVT